MGQKIHPTGFRLAVSRNWTSKWFANSKHFANTLNEDIRVREYLKKKLSHASVAKVTIERPAKNARIIKKVLESAIANAEHNDGADIDELRITTIYVDKADTLKRMSTRAKGRGNVIGKQSCHIHVAVGDRKKGDAPAKPAAAKPAKVGPN